MWFVDDGWRPLEPDCCSIILRTGLGRRARQTRGCASTTWTLQHAPFAEKNCFWLPAPLRAMDASGGLYRERKKNLDILGDNVQQNEFAMGLIDTGEICCRPPPRNQLGVSAVLGALLQLLCNKEERSRPPCQRGGNVPAPETGLGGPSALGTENC